MYTSQSTKAKQMVSHARIQGGGARGPWPPPPPHKILLPQIVRRGPRGPCPPPGGQEGPPPPPGGPRGPCPPPYKILDPPMGKHPHQVCDGTLCECHVVTTLIKSHFVRCILGWVNLPRGAGGISDLVLFPSPSSLCITNILSTNVVIDNYRR